MTATRFDRARLRIQRRRISLAQAQAAIRLYASSMPDHEPTENDDDEDGSPSFTEPEASTFPKVWKCR